MASTTTTWGLRLDNELLARLDTLAARQGCERTQLVREMLRRAVEQAEKAPEVDLETFAAQVLDVARTCETGRFGSDRVFVSHVLRAYERRHGTIGIGQFKHQLAQTNNQSLLMLVCADMPAHMDQTDVKESTIRYLSGTFHLVCV